MVPTHPSSRRTEESPKLLCSNTDGCCSAKKQVTDQGGKITTEFKLIKGFTFVQSIITTCIERC